MKQLFASIVVVVSVAALGIEPPSGWRLPTENELPSKGIGFRDESPTRYAVAIADFDGDGSPDTAALMKNTERNGEGLLVKLSASTDDDWIVLSQIDWGEEYPSVDLAMGIKIQPSGTVPTACGKGYWECKPDEPSQLTLERPGILYFRFESAASVFRWDEDQVKFIRVWISD